MVTMERVIYGSLCRGAAVLTIGCHLSIAKGYAHAAREACRLGASTFQFFTRNPRGGKAKALDAKDLEALREVCAQQGITSLLAHAPYTLNPASDKERTCTFARETLTGDLERLERIGASYYNMHPGSHVGQGAAAGIEKIAACINAVLAEEQGTVLLLETMAGKGSEVGGAFEELATIIERVELSSHVGVCLDTCHAWDAGYDIAGNLDGVLEEFDRVIGLSRLKAVHLNDSKNPCGARKDRHERLGEGCIGFDALAAVVSHPALRGLPFYLETPQESVEGYAAEIARVRAACEIEQGI